MDRAIRFRDRETGEIRVETVFAEGMLRFLYENRFGRLLTHGILRYRWFSRLYGWLQRSRRSRRRIPEFVRTLGINADEAERPLDSYESLDDFFTRKLKPGARPIDRNPDHLIAPADGRALVIPRVEAQRFSIKGSAVTLADLVGEPLARRYLGGSMVIVRLAPADYHRFHFVETGTASEAWELGRHLHSVHPIALGSGAPSFRNHRMITQLSTASFGEILQIEIGALGVGTMEQTYRPGPVERGQEKGMFRFGGSTAVVLLEPGRVTLDADLVESSRQGLETFVKMGTRIGCRA